MEGVSFSIWRDIPGLGCCGNRFAPRIASCQALVQGTAETAFELTRNKSGVESLRFCAVAKYKVSARTSLAGGEGKAGEKKASQAGYSPAEHHYGLAGAGAGSALLEAG